VPCTIWCKILLGNATLLPFAAQAVTDVYPACLTAPPRGIHASVFDSSYLNRAGIIGTFVNPRTSRITSFGSSANNKLDVTSVIDRERTLMRIKRRVRDERIHSGTERLVTRIARWLVQGQVIRTFSGHALDGPLDGLKPRSDR